ncbi:MAG: RHS repeat domain-containing protein, partial [Akkermansiaceae bacterium]
AENRLTKIIYADNSSTEFQYNGLSQRVRVIEKSAANATISDKRYLWAGGNQPTEERDSSGTTVLKRYFPQGEQIPAAAAPLDKLFYTKDHLGNIRELTDSNGALQTRYDYDMWGKRVKLFGTLDTDVGFTGHHHHAKSGLVLTWVRAYDAEVGRWLSADPLGEAGGINLYGYVGGNPINLIDPTGEFAFIPVVLVVWGGIELGLAIYDAYDTVKTIADPSKTTGQKVAAGVLFAAGALAPGGGYSKIDDAVECVQKCKNAAKGLADLPGKGKPGWTKLKGDQGWKDADGNMWNKDKLHKDHWDVSDKKGNKIREVDYDGNQIWPGGPKNKNK